MRPDIALWSTGMILRHTRRLKDGKEHLHGTVVENRRCMGGRILQKTVLYLGEINDSQKTQWIRGNHPPQ